MRWSADCCFGLYSPTLSRVGLGADAEGHYLQQLIPGTYELRYGAVLGLLSAYIALAFMQELLEGMVPMPSWVMSLSIFHLYGNPIFLGVNWNNFLGMTAVAIVLLVISLLQFRSADIELG